PVEINEAEIPIKICRYGLVPDSGGPGEYRGGLAMRMEFQVFSPDSIVTARNRNRTRFSSWGVLGGLAGGTSRFVRNPGTERAIDLGNVDVVRCEPGDVLLIEGPGAGGYGSPAKRPIAAVLRDVAAGFVTPEGARRYGVVMNEELKLDEEATERL